MTDLPEPNLKGVFISIVRLIVPQLSSTPDHDLLARPDRDTVRDFRHD